MSMLDFIRDRRSCRNFLQTEVEEEKLNAVLQAGLYAPSPANKQPWEFIVVTNEEVKKNFKAEVDPTLEKLAQRSDWKWLNSYKVDFLLQAPVLIVVLGDPSKNGAEQFLDEAYDGYLEASSAAVQNMLLAAHIEGLGSLWFSLYEKMSAKTVFNIEEGKEPIAVICLGYPASPSNMPRRKELAEKVRYIK